MSGQSTAGPEQVQEEIPDEAADCQPAASKPEQSCPACYEEAELVRMLGGTEELPRTIVNTSPHTIKAGDVIALVPQHPPNPMLGEEGGFMTLAPDCVRLPHVGDLGFVTAAD